MQILVQRGPLAAHALCVDPHSGTLHGYQLGTKVPAPGQNLETQDDGEGGLISIPIAY